MGSSAPAARQRSPNDTGPHLHVALVHYPVVDKNGKLIASSLTPTDLHDIARAGQTFGVHGFYVVTPLEDQHQLVNRFLKHWTQGHGAQYNPARRTALASVAVVDTIAAAVAQITAAGHQAVTTVATSSRRGADTVGYGHLRRKLNDGGAYLLLLGTAWGLADTVFETADIRLAPISGSGVYNHLSVRAAAAIILDRLLGRAD